MQRKDYKRVLVRAPNWIGDAVLCLPALSRLKTLMPGASITVITKSRAVPVFQSLEYVNDVIEYDDRKRHRGLAGRLKLAGEIKKRGFELAVLFQNAFDAALLSFISRIPARIGYARDMRSGLLTNAIKVTPEIKRRHQAFYYLKIIEELGAKPLAGPFATITLTHEEDAWAIRFLKDNELEGFPLAGASPGASYGPAKRWKEEGYAEVLMRLSRERGCTPLIFGGPEDAASCKNVSAALKCRHLDLCGKITLRQFMALLTRLKVFLTNDSGPMHLASALDTPTVAVFGSTSPELTGPMGTRATVIKTEIDCSPCFERTCKYGHYKCLGSIETDEVYKAAEAFLKGR